MNVIKEAERRWNTFVSMKYYNIYYNINILYNF